MADEMMTDERFDQLLQELRNEGAASNEAAAASQRVWQRLGSPLCAGFRVELAAYLAGEIPATRRLLIEDHLSRCTDCRRALADLKGDRLPVMISEGRRRFVAPSWTPWAVAAGLLVAGLYLGRDRIDATLAPAGPRATVVAVSGAVYRLPQTVLAPGVTLAEGDVIRTTAGARTTLRLTDGSLVEMNQRTEMAVNAAWSGQTIRLDRGDVMVQAAKQRRGHLRVMTRDTIASVKGTVFSVSSDSAGSLVSVVEGSVAVAQPRAERLLTKGQQAATNPSLERVSVRQAISWSQDAEKYYSLLAELVQIEKQLAETAPPLRTQSSVLPYLPSGVQIYVALPNLDGTIRQALFQLEQRARENTALGEWWAAAQGQELKKLLDRLQSVTPLLGDEVVFALVQDDANSKTVKPLLLAQIQPGWQEALRTALERIAAENGGDGQIAYRFAQNLLLVSDSAADVATLAARLGGGSNSDFVAEIARRYQTGVGWLAAVDTTRFNAVRETTPGRALGLLNMKYLIFEQQTGGGRDGNEVTLSFNGQRTGIASWLASPGSAGSAEYVSGEALAAFSASTRDPRQAFDELLGMLGSQDGIADALHKFEGETGINFGNDIASVLGTDFTFAIEQPTLPVPGWIGALEVVRPSALNDTVQRLTDVFNRQSTNKLIFSRESINGREWLSLKGSTGVTVYWTYDRGYLIASMDRALAARAIATRESGTSLVRSATFQQSFPAASGLHHSGFVWLNAKGVLEGLSALLQASGYRSAALKTLLDGSNPTLVVLDGEMERIHAASRTRLTSLLLDLTIAQHAGKL